MAEEFCGLGSTFYVGLPGQSVEEMQEVKLQHASEVFKLELEDVDATNPSKSYSDIPLTFEVRDDHSFELSKMCHYFQQQQRVAHEYQKIIKEATCLMALWLKDRRSVSRYIRLRRHYNRWRRCYATRKTFYTTPFHKFMNAFMVEYVVMRIYHSKHNT